MRRPDTDNPDTLTRVREARRDATPAERKLWSALRARQLAGAKFRRQSGSAGSLPISFARKRQVIEVDGDTHARQSHHDERRTKWLAVEGFRVVRVTNADVMQNLDGVLECIGSALPSPSQS